MSPLAWLYRNGLALALVAALVALGVQSLRLSTERESHAQTRRAHAEQLAALAETARQAEAREREREQRWAQEREEIIHDANQREARARADLAGAADAGRRLREQIASLTARCRAASADPAPAGAGPAADATERVLADVQRRLDEAQDRVAGFADQAHGAGRACERAYDSLNGRSPQQRAQPVSFDP